MPPIAPTDNVTTLQLEELAIAILQLADDSGMPDSFWQTDSRVALARAYMGVEDHERYSKGRLWDREDCNG